MLINLTLGSAIADVYIVSDQKPHAQKWIFAVVRNDFQFPLLPKPVDQACVPL